MADTDGILNSAKDSDRAVGFFNDIFGVGWEKIIHGTTPSGEFGNVLFEIFFAFNAVVLAGVSVLMFYVVSSGIVGTAHEGESLGKRYSTLWTPLRSALAISFLMPLPWAKLSMMQALVLKFLFLSIGGASYISVTAVEFMEKMGGALTMPSVPSHASDAMAESILANLVIQEYFREQEGVDGGDTLSISNGTVRGFAFSAPSTELTKISQESMGAIKLDCASVSESLCQSMITSAANLTEALRPLAVDIASAHPDGANTELGQEQVDSFFTEIKQYNHDVQHAMTEELSSSFDDSAKAEMADFKQRLTNNGWTWLGLYYWKMAKINEAAQGMIAIAPNVKQINRHDVINRAGKEFEPTMARYEGFTNRTKTISNEAKSITHGESSGAGDLLGSLIMDGIGSSFSSNNTAVTGAAGTFASVIATGDPIANLQKMGHSLINTGSIMLTGMGAAKVVGWVWDFMPSGKAANLASKAASNTALSKVAGILEGVGSIVVPIVMTLMIVGVGLAYYLPALPFILWISAIIGWIVLTMEVMVAAPIWAAMHAVPEGEGMAGQHGRQGYMLFMGILFRPALHVIGFFMSIIIIGVVARFIGEAYVDFSVMSGQNDEPIGIPAQIVAWLATLILGSIIMIIASHKVFGLMTWLPDNLLRWAGSGSPSLGENNDESRGSSMFAAAVSRSQSTTLNRVTAPKMGGSGAHSQGESGGGLGGVATAAATGGAGQAAAAATKAGALGLTQGEKKG